MLFTMSFLIKTVSNSSCGGFIKDTQDVEIGDDSCILGGLTLGVIKVSRNSDDGIVDFLVEELLSSFSHLSQYHGTNLLSVEFLLFSFKVYNNSWLVLIITFNFEGPHFHILLHNWVCKFTADESFCIEDCIFGISGNLILGRITDQSF